MQVLPPLNERQSEIHMGDSPQQSFPSCFHLPSRRQIRHRLTFAVDSESTSLPAVSVVDHQTLRAEASASHPEYTSADNCFNGAEGCKERRSTVSLRRQQVHASGSTCLNAGNGCRKRRSSAPLQTQEEHDAGSSHSGRTKHRSSVPLQRQEEHEAGFSHSSSHVRRRRSSTVVRRGRQHVLQPDLAPAPANRHHRTISSPHYLRWPRHACIYCGARF